MTTMALSRLHFPVRVLGPGTRAGIWFQGCSIGCHGCVSQDTWTAGREHLAQVEDVVAWVGERADRLDGVTISGGEPFEQPAALEALLTGLRALPEPPGRPRDLLCYSGLDLAVLRRRHAKVLDLLDVVVTGPYVRHRAAALALRGSSNQVVVTLSDLGRQRYAGIEEAPPTGMQVAASDGVLWYVGIPAPGDLDRLQAMLRERGVDQQEVSWAPRTA